MHGTHAPFTMDTKLRSSCAPASELFLRMKLHAECNIPVLHGARKGHAVRCFPNDERPRWRDITMREVEILTRGNTREQQRREVRSVEWFRRLTSRRNHRVPTNVGNFVSKTFWHQREAFWSPRPVARPNRGVARGRFVILVRRAFYAFFKQQMHPQANTKERHAIRDAAADDVGLPERRHGGSRIGKRTHAWQHHSISLRDSSRVVGNTHLAPPPPQDRARRF